MLATTFYISNATAVSNLVLSGLFDRFPNLYFVSVESGITWIHFVLESAEWQLDEFCSDENKLLQRRPKEYFRDHISACFWFEKYAVQNMLPEIGVNNVMFMTDFTHPTCQYPFSNEYLADVVAPPDRRLTQTATAYLSVC